ncbi:hypothetical protein DB347_19820 [Opitutaceae bacterium EW11]|nr:hypothetical protein DB347_19820 [Opitutaceae bacterium EW11]
MRSYPLSLTLALLLVGGAAAGAEPSRTVTALSLNRTRDVYRFVAPETPKPEETVPAEETNREIVSLPKFTVKESYAARTLAQDVEAREEELKLEEFDWVNGGLIHRKTGRTFTVDTGIWAPGKIMEFVRIRW